MPTDAAGLMATGETVLVYAEVVISTAPWHVATIPQHRTQWAAAAATVPLIIGKAVAPGDPDQLWLPNGTYEAVVYYKRETSHNDADLEQEVTVKIIDDRVISALPASGLRPYAGRS